LTNQDEGRTHNKGAKMGADGSRVSTFCFSIWLHIVQGYWDAFKGTERALFTV
jgi:hypothetical protein